MYQKDTWNPSPLAPIELSRDQEWPAIPHNVRPQFFTSSPLWSMTQCANQLHLTTRYNFRIHLLLSCHGFESDPSSQSNGQACLVNFAVPSSNMLPTLYLLILSSCKTWICLPAHDPDLFAHILLRIDKFKCSVSTSPVELKAFRAELKKS